MKGFWRFCKVLESSSLGVLRGLSEQKNSNPLDRVMRAPVLRHCSKAFRVEFQPWLGILGSRDRRSRVEDLGLSRGFSFGFSRAFRLKGSRGLDGFGFRVYRGSGPIYRGMGVLDVSGRRFIVL